MTLFLGKWAILGTKMFFFVKIHFASSFQYTSRHELSLFYLIFLFIVTIVLMSSWCPT